MGVHYFIYLSPVYKNIYSCGCKDVIRERYKSFLKRLHDVKLAFSSKDVIRIALYEIVRKANNKCY